MEPPGAGASAGAEHVGHPGRRHGRDRPAGQAQPEGGVGVLVVAEELGRDAADPAHGRGAQQGRAAAEAEDLAAGGVGAVAERGQPDAGGRDVAVGGLQPGADRADPGVGVQGVLQLGEPGGIRGGVVVEPGHEVGAEAGKRRGRCPYKHLGLKLPSYDLWELLQRSPDDLELPEDVSTSELAA